MGKLNVAVVCSSNMNRSMEGHSVLVKKNFKTKSFGTGDRIKIPGRSMKEPNVYPFGTTYEEIYNDLVKKDKKLYTENGMLHILDRNRRIKEKPERFQEAQERFDVILTCEERCYDLVVANFEEMDSTSEQPVHVINIDIVDNPEDATIGAFLFADLMQMFDASSDLDDDIDEILQLFEEKCDRSVFHTLCFY